MLANPYRPYTRQFFQEKWPTQPDDQLLLSLVVGNKPGVLGRIALVFSRRGCNIESLNVHHTLDRRFSHMMVMIQGSTEKFTEIVKNCQKIVDVIHVTPVQQNQTSDQQVQQALRLEITCQMEHKKLILQCVQYSSFQIVDFKDQVLTIEKAEREHTDEAMLAILKHYALIQVLENPLPADQDHNTPGHGSYPAREVEDGTGRYI